MTALFIFIFLLLLAALFYLGMLGEYRRRSPWVERYVREWAAFFRLHTRVEKAPEGRITSFSGTFRDWPFSCQYHARFERLGAAPQLILAVERPVAVELDIFREGWIRRLTKKVGLDREMQTGDDYFDRAFYLEYRDEATPRSLLQSGRVRGLINEFFSPANGGRRLECGKKGVRLTISLASPRLMATLKIDRLLARLADLGGELTVTTEADIESDPDEFRQRPIVAMERRRWFANFLHAGILAMFGWLVGFAGSAPVYSIESSIWSSALLLSLLFTLFVTILGYFLFRGTAYSSKILSGLVVAYLTANFIFAVSALRYFNCQWDHSRTEYSDSIVIGKESRMGRDLLTRHYLIVSRDGGYTQEKFLVPKVMYEQYERGKKLVIGRKAGRLGFAWVSEIRPIGK